MDDRWQQIERIFLAALEMDRNARAEYLAKACGGDEDLRREVESLLGNAEQAGSFLESPALEMAAESLTKDEPFSGVRNPELESGAMIAHYRVTAKLGEGGMGVVYRARDTRLQRDVALKILPQALVHSAQPMARFEREARVLASLNHPNIAAIHGLEESNGIRALVMELVEGDTLAERISVAAGGVYPGGAGDRRSVSVEESDAHRAPLQIDEALPIARQIAEALEYAHERGVIHRDLKPANVKITPEGTVKVLDFGLAKVLNPQDAPAATDPGNSPTLTTMATRPGTILGTASYMSPEQAKGQRVDRRCDIWAFGCVFYEMLTGRKAFEGETITDVLAAVITKEPDWTTLPQSTPPSVQKLVRRCLQKEQRQRLRDIGDGRITIEETISGAGEGCALPTDSTVQRKLKGLRYRALPWAAGFLIGAIVASLIVWRALSSRTPATRPPQELSEQRLTANPSEDPVQAAAISPDGKFLAYSDQDGTHLRLIKTGDTKDLVSHRQLTVSSISWLPDGSGMMVTGSQHGESAGIWVISVLGGTPRKLRDNAAQPAVSPDGSRVAFLTGPEAEKGPVRSAAPNEIWVMSASGEQARRLLTGQPDQAFRRLRWSPGGHRIMYLKSYFARGGPDATIESVDLKGGAGAPVVSFPILGDFCWLPDGRVLYSRQTAFTGTTPATQSSLWEISVDTHTGKTKGTPAKVANGAGFYFSRLSRTADGNQLVFLRLTTHSVVSVGNLNPQGTALTKLHQLTFEGEWPEGWTPDGKAVVFWSGRSGKSAFYKKNLTGGEAVLLFPSSKPVWYVRYSPDDAWFLYMALPKSPVPGPTVPVNIMRVAVSGGAPQLVLRARGMTDLRCTRSPANVCVYDELDQQGQAFFEFDPIRGKGREVARIHHGHEGGSSSWDLSPDGSRLAVIDSAEGEGRIKLISLNGGPSSELAVKGWNGLTEMDWSTDGKGMYVSSVTPQHTAVLRVDLKGRAIPLWEGNSSMRDTCGRPSPDGRHLAIAVWTTHSNAWTMKNF